MNEWMAFRLLAQLVIKLDWIELDCVELLLLLLHFIVSKIWVLF
jgi:hypothetical protein